MSDPHVQKAASVAAPWSGSVSSTDKRPTQRLSGTTGEATVTQLLPVGEMATIVVGAQAVRITFASATGLSTQVATTDMLLTAGARFDWEVQPQTAAPYIQSSDASTAYEAWVWHSSI